MARTTANNYVIIVVTVHHLRINPVLLVVLGTVSRIGVRNTVECLSAASIIVMETPGRFHRQFA